MRHRSKWERLNKTEKCIYDSHKFHAKEMVIEISRRSESVHWPPTSFMVCSKEFTRLHGIGILAPKELNSSAEETMCMKKKNEKKDDFNVIEKNANNKNLTMSSKNRKYFYFHLSADYDYFYACSIQIQFKQLNLLLSLVCFWFIKEMYTHTYC